MKTVKKGIYRHYKGSTYEVIGVATHSETGEQLVVYRALPVTKKLWVRPKEMFCEKVVKNAKPVPRFEYLRKSVPLV